MKRLLRLAALLNGGAKPSKNLLNVLAHETPHGIPESAFSNGVIDDPSIGEGNADFVRFTQVFAAGTYTFSLKTEGEGVTGVRILTSVEITGSQYNSYYGGYFKDIEGGYITFETSATFGVGIIFVTDNDHASKPGKAYDIQLEAGSEPTPYEPYR